MNDPRPDGCEPSPALVDRARGDDAEAREALVRLVYPLVVRWARAGSGDPADAEDVAHDALVRMLRSLDGFRGESRFTSWLYRIVRNVALDRHQRRARRRAREEGMTAAREVPVRGPGPADDAERHELLRRIRTAFTALPPRQREVFDMAELQGLTSPEIAARLDVAPSTVRVTLLHARRAVREALLDCEAEPREGST